MARRSRNIEEEEGAEDGLTEYERKRLQNIARNREQLARLGLDQVAPNPGKPPARKRVREKAEVPEELRRRSGRVRHQPAQVYTTFERNEDFGDHVDRDLPVGRFFLWSLVLLFASYVWGHPQSPPALRTSQPCPLLARQVDRDGLADPGMTRPKKRSAPAGPPPPPAPGSTRAMDADVEGVLAEFLGKEVPPREGSSAMKAAVMARLLGQGGREPRFNKYAGVQVRGVGLP